MGAAKSLFGYGARPHKQVLLVGLDAAGKTTLLYKLKAGKVEMTIPTIGFNVEHLEMKGGMDINAMVAWDVGGRDKLRPLWRHYFRHVDGLIFMVDSSDYDRMKEARDELNNILTEDELLDKPLLVYANKQDLQNSLPVRELTDRLGLHNIRGRAWYIQESVATQGKGIHEGLEWLGRQLRNAPGTDQPAAHLSVKSQGVLAKPASATPADDVSTADTEDATARAEVIKAHP